MKFMLFFIFTVATCYCSTEFSARATNFSIELTYYTQLETDGHVVISPFGIWSLMTGVALGATHKSRKQLLTAFVLPTEQNTIVNGYKNLTKTVLDPITKEVTLSSQNFVFLDKRFSIKEAFKRTLARDFNAMINNLDFNDPGAAEQANTIIERSGATVANVLVSSDFAESKMILTNVVSFKGLWGSPFNVSDTAVEPFYDENKKQVIGEVQMMYQRAQLPYSHLKEMKAFVLELPYGHDEKYCMLILLPYPKVKVSSIFSKFTTITFRDIFEKLSNDTRDFGLEDVDVKLPRFKISTNLVLNRPLNNMGVYDIFDPKKASFERVSGEEIYISKIVHKADIEVTESGTVASAATSAYFSDRISTPTFEANRPFMYFVMEKPTATIIFSGIYSKPSVF